MCAEIIANADDLEEDILEELRGIVGDRISTSTAVREHHGKGEGFPGMCPPAVVVFPLSTEEVSEIVKVCAREKLPIVPFGTGTSLEGHVVALRGGVCIDLSRMDRVVTVNVEDLDVTVQPGVRRKQLNEHLRDTGLFFPIDPGADASIGGMTATRASGTNAVRYGTMRENVLSLTVVLPDGRIIRTARRARKSAAGYDLTRLYIGSEGTLGVITEITLRLYGIPEAVSAAVASFPDLESAVNTVILTIQSGVPVARVELLDEVQMDALNNYSSLDYPVQPTLFFEFHGSHSGVKEQAEIVQEIAGDFDSADFKWTANEEERNRLWQARHDAYPACKAIRPGAVVYATDVCVPISRLAECLIETRKDIDEAGILAPIVGHVGDGNFHLSPVFDPNDKEEVRKVDEINERMVLRALAMDGTCTGEHGVGLHKMDFLVSEHGDAISVMRIIKAALDPDNIMNPGKVIQI